MAVTLKKICEEAGVSKATVSRVLNNHALVSKETRAKVQEVIERLHFKPNALARNLSLQKTECIGVIFPWIFSGFFSTVLLGIDMAARKHGYHIITSLFHNQSNEEDSAWTLLEERRIDGLILMGPNLPLDKLRELKRQQLPFVVLQQEIPDKDISYVSVDNFDGGYQAGKHLIDKGYKRILAMAASSDSQDSNRREEGFKKALKEAGIPFDPDLLIRSEFNKETAVPNFELYRQQFPMPEAVFCFNDDIALGMLKYFRAIGVRVPEDIAVIGFDGIEFTDFAELSTVVTPMKEMGEQATSLLIKQVENKEANISEQRLLKGEVAARNSTNRSKS
jgi:DNA-binding LacI/PurR family transcriptional regulator